MPGQELVKNNSLLVHSQNLLKFACVHFVAVFNLRKFSCLIYLVCLTSQDLDANSLNVDTRCVNLVSDENTTSLTKNLMTPF